MLKRDCNNNSYTVERRLSGQLGTAANPDNWTTLKNGYGNVSLGKFPSHLSRLRTGHCSYAYFSILQMAFLEFFFFFFAFY